MRETAEMLASMDIDHLRSWIGRNEERVDVAAAAPLGAMAATLDHEVTAFDAGGEVPPLWHWCYFLPVPRLSDLGPDGHPKKGGLLPPIPLPRRMWAGSNLRFLRPLVVGERISRRSVIEDVTLKEGRTGRLAFVKVRHEVCGESGLAIVEQQDIVYRNPSTPADAAPAPSPAPTGAQWMRTITPSTALLFRYSALTFNSHRIHYDRAYAQQDEGYGGLVVHGPMIATLLVDLVRQNLPHARIVEFSFRAVRPLLDTSDFMVCGTQKDATVELWAQGSDGSLATTAAARVA